MLRLASDADGGSTRRDVLVAIMNNVRDLEIARESHWYRIPVRSVEKWLKDCWPPTWLAFYQTRVFERGSHSVTYYAQVQDIRNVRRCELFPEEPSNDKSHRLYAQLMLGPLQELAEPILSRRFRWISFIPTTWEKFRSASEINDLFDESPLEDQLWSQLKRLRIPAERQEFTEVDGNCFALDFAVYCSRGNLAIETDGDTWHANPQKAAQDNVRDNALKKSGWNVLRFSSAQIMEQLADYCLPTIIETINSLGGVAEGEAPRRIGLPTKGGLHQKGLFDEL
jgi:very-short-patch-repair endonuclease